jgi:2',3'-cyclic-nucleotide 2'-phosphodiesterase
VKLLFVGDVVGGIGRRTLAGLLPGIRDTHKPDFVIVNGENSAGGVGVTEKTARELFETGADAITLGNHAYRHREVYGYLDREERIVRPVNFPAGNPGRGSTVVEVAGKRVCVLNLSGQVHLNVARNSFLAVDAELEKIDADVVIVDFHAEVTSEKVAMGWHLDGRVAAVFGSHTHVPTADARVLPGGTAVVTDVGMTGSRAGVIGVKRHDAIEALRTLMPVRFETADEDLWVNAACAEINERGLADSVEQILMPCPVN